MEPVLSMTSKWTLYLNDSKPKPTLEDTMKIKHLGYKRIK
jgi:hypothetical protein